MPKPHKPSKRPAKKPSSPVADPHQSLYGVLPVLTALQVNRRKFFKVWIKSSDTSERLQAIHNLAKKRRMQINFVDRQQLDLMCPHGLHQGVFMECGPLPYESEALLSQKAEQAEPNNPPFFVALDQLEDPQNIGAIIRSAAFFGASGLVVPRQGFPGVTSTVSKTSAGIAEQFPVIVVANLARFLEAQKNKNYWSLGLSMEGDAPISSFKRDRPMIMVLGNEGTGIRPLVKKTCDWLVQIPGSPDVESLNVSNAAAVMLYQLSQTEDA